jgi:hypothetical protein
MDGALCRLILLLCEFERTSVHDSFGVHPNNGAALIKNIKAVYIKIFCDINTNVIYQLLFEPSIEAIPKQTKEALLREFKLIKSPNAFEKSQMKNAILRSTYIVKLDV